MYLIHIATEIWFRIDKNSQMFDLVGACDLRITKSMTVIRNMKIFRTVSLPVVLYGMKRGRLIDGVM